MANDATKVRVAVTGSLYWDKTAAAAAPTGTGSALDALLKDLGYVSEDGVSLTLPDAGDSTTLHAWQNGAQVRVLRSITDDSPQLSLTLIETKLEVIETVFGVTVTQAVSDGSFEIDIQDTKPHGRLALDVIDGSELIRLYAPRPIVTSVGEISLTSTDAIGYNVTIDLERDSTAGYNAKVWMTALKS